MCVCVCVRLFGFVVSLLSTPRGPPMMAMLMARLSFTAAYPEVTYL